MNMQEMTRLLLGLKKIGMTAEEINNFLIYIESGREEYEPETLIKR